MKNRVVVTGLGVVAANGIGVDAFWKSLLENQSGIGRISLFDTTGFSNNIAGEVRGFSLQQFVSKPLKISRLARHTQFALAATAMALKSSGLKNELTTHRGPVPVVMGTSTSAVDIVQHGVDTCREKGPRHTTPFVITHGPPHAMSCEIARVFEIPAAVTTISNTCASGVDAIGTAFHIIRSGRADIAIAGSTDAPLTPSSYASLLACNMASKQQMHPAKASRPFDIHRDGGVMAEGSGVIILESLDHALARQARILSEVTGYSSQLDDLHGPPGNGIANAMKAALCNASRLPRDVDLVNAHGPSDPQLDRTETEAIKSALGGYSSMAAVVSIKGATGNPLSAAGTLQAISTAMSIHTGIIPPTTNYEYPDPECDLDYVPRTPRHHPVHCAVINSHGIGGGNSCLIMERVA